MLEFLPLEAEPTRLPFRPVGLAGLNPFAEDDPADFPILTSERRLLRLVICAADVAARFAREKLANEAAAWMLSPAPMFDFDRPLEACQELDGFRRATLFNGLQVDPCASRGDLDTLVLDDALTCSCAPEPCSVSTSEWRAA